MQKGKGPLPLIRNCGSYGIFSFDFHVEFHHFYICPHTDLAMFLTMFLVAFPIA